MPAVSFLDPCPKIYLHWHHYRETKHMKIVLSRNTLKTKCEKTKLFHLKETCAVSEMRFAEATVIHHCRKTEESNWMEIVLE